MPCLLDLRLILICAVLLAETLLAFDFMDFDLDFPASDITHCSFNPVACILLCGSPNPGCDMTGPCQCTHHPSSDAECEEPGLFDFGKCNNFNCHRHGHKAYVCSYNGDKICVCSPPKPGDATERKTNFTFRQRFHEP